MVGKLSNRGADDAAAVMLVDLNYAVKERVVHEGRGNLQESPVTSVPKAVSLFASNRTDGALCVSIATLPDPADGDTRQYLLVSAGRKNNDDTLGCDIHEIQSLRPSGGGRYGSFFVGSRVVSNPSLHVSTRVDPLFFVLAHLTRPIAVTDRRNQEGGGGGGSCRWQPLDQLLADVPDAVRRAISRQPEQIGHLCDSTDRFGDDLILHKFNEKRAIAWLVAKHDRAADAAKRRAVEAAERSQSAKHFEAATASGGSGAFNDAFYMPEDEKSAVGVSPTTSASTEKSIDALSFPASLTKYEEEMARVAGLQMICEYLSEEWRGKLVTALDMSQVDLLGEKCRKRQENSGSISLAGQKRRWEGNPGEDEADKLLQYTMGVDGGGGSVGVSKANAGSIAMNGKIKAAMKAQSVGLKKLAKVNKKGMKSLATFFGGGIKKKAKKT